jgi:hypothetical protein
VPIISFLFYFPQPKTHISPTGVTNERAVPSFNLKSTTVGVRGCFPFSFPFAFIRTFVYFVPVALHYFLRLRFRTLYSAIIIVSKDTTRFLNTGPVAVKRRVAKLHVSTFEATRYKCPYCAVSEYARDTHKPGPHFSLGGIGSGRGLKARTPKCWFPLVSGHCHCGMRHGIIPVPLIRVGPPGYFIHISITTPVVSALKNYYI